MVPDEGTGEFIVITDQELDQEDAEERRRSHQPYARRPPARHRRPAAPRHRAPHRRYAARGRSIPGLLRPHRGGQKGGGPGGEAVGADPGGGIAPQPGRGRRLGRPRGRAPGTPATAAAVGRRSAGSGTAIAPAFPSIQAATSGSMAANMPASMNAARAFPVSPKRAAISARRAGGGRRCPASTLPRNCLVTPRSRARAAAVMPRTRRAASSQAAKSDADEADTGQSA